MVKGQEQQEEITPDDFKNYLVNHLLCSDRNKQLETAFILYLYISRKKVEPLLKQDIENNAMFADTIRSNQSWKRAENQTPT